MSTDIEQRAREIAHRYSPRCTGDKGYAPGGDGPRYHSKNCDALRTEIVLFLRETSTVVEGIKQAAAVLDERAELIQQSAKKTHDEWVMYSEGEDRKANIRERDRLYEAAKEARHCAASVRALSTP